MDLTIYDQTSNGISQEQHELIEKILQFAAKKLNLADNTEMSVTLMNNPAIKKINAQYRALTGLPTSLASRPRRVATNRRSSWIRN